MRSRPSDPPTTMPDHGLTQSSFSPSLPRIRYFRPTSSIRQALYSASQLTTSTRGLRVSLLHSHSGPGHNRCQWPSESLHWWPTESLHPQLAFLLAPPLDRASFIR